MMACCKKETLLQYGYWVGDRIPYSGCKVQGCNLQEIVMSIECQCCDTFECSRRQAVMDSIEQVPFALDPIAMRKFQLSVRFNAYNHPNVNHTSFNALYYSPTVAFGG